MSARCRDEEIVLAAGAEIVGTVSLELSDGPLGQRPYNNPSFVEATFDFQLGDRLFQSRSTLSCQHLWAADGTQVENDHPDFVDEVGQLDGMMDGRDEWYYLRPDGSKHSNRLKCTSCHIHLMVRELDVLVRCRYYDQNSEIADYVTIYYPKAYSDLLLLPDDKLYFDANGNVEDHVSNGAEFTTLEEP
ncbi:MAG: hypothetical protein R3F19_09950 [Verrucomicrobiales bacterium]